MNKTFLFILARLREPSTMAVISGAAVLAGLPPGTVDAGAAAVAGVAGLIAALLPEGK
jgi:hypothetical protein